MISSAKTVPVFEVDQRWYDTVDPLPGVWITQRAQGCGNECLGRKYVMLYSWDDPSDPDGSIALSFGADYYLEAMGYSAAADRQARIECFQAAEILYLHAAAKGNVYAYLNLGYVYSYDRCEGRYFVDRRHSEDASGDAPYPREQRAFECFEFAAKSGDAEACYKLGDLYKRGVGCEPDAAEALRWYMHAFELKDGMPPHVWGSIALRLGDAYENGIGCEFDLEKALDWYRKAETGLDIGVRSGEAFYGRTLANVRAAMKRIVQELDGRY